MTDLPRRRFLTLAAAGGTAAAAAGLSAPAVAQSSPAIKWRLTGSYPKALDTLYGGSETFAKLVSEATDGNFQIQVFAPGEIVPGLQALDAVIAGTVECCYTAPYYYIGKHPAYAFGSVIPFGMNTRAQNAWLFQGGGNELMGEFYKTQGVTAFPGGNTGCQMGGWWRKEIKSLDDVRGVKFRIAGHGGHVCQKLGMVPQQIAGGDIYPALEKGAIDAAEWVGPYDDEKLGFHKVAKFFYYPGWWEGNSCAAFFMKTDVFEALPKTYKTALQTAAAYCNVDVMAKYDARNPAALKRLVAQGAQLRPFPQDVMDAGYKASNEFMAEIAGQNPAFKKIFDSYAAFRGDQYLWQQVSELTYDVFMVRATQSRG